MIEFDGQGAFPIAPDDSPLLTTEVRVRVEMHELESMPHTAPTVLRRIRFVLVEPSLSANQGAVARAMKTMGLSQLVLVRPRQALDATALARAAGADDLLAAAQRHDDLTAALAGCRLVIGTSARRRSLAWPELEPRAAAAQLLVEAAHGEVALVFGRESSGLSNDELARCHYLTRIPTDPDFASLNLGAAAQVFAYEIRRAWCASETIAPAAAAPDTLATADELEGFYRHLRKTLIRLGFADPDQSRQLDRRLRRLFNRARPDRTELAILRGILNAATGAKSPDRFRKDLKDGG